VTGHLRWRPDPAWTLGLSWSDGAYLQDAAEALLPAGRQVDDYSQTTAGLDLAYQHRDLQIWSELAYSRFEVPAVGEVSVTSGFVEVRYKVAPRWWLAGRWNQSWFEEVAGPAGTGADPGEDISWDRDLHAADVGIGYRHTAHLQGKLEYRWVDQQGTDVNGRHRLTGQLVFWF
jgi:hypothetical protein